MVNIKLSVRAFEDRLRQALGGEVVERDLVRKHELMTESPFVFLRATFWRWAESILEVCPELAEAPPVLAVGDIHLENFGTWRDADGRLVWGVNDFDEAAEMPYVLDLVRLATSALLAGPDREMSSAEICAAVLDGYRHGLRAPKAIVLDRDWAWLRKLVEVPNKDRARFWQKIDKAKYMGAPKPYIDALAGAMPQVHLQMRTAPRVAGTGSLGRPRWIGVAEWQGAPVVREAKAMLPSAWPQAGNHPARASRCEEITKGRFRANDPWYALHGSLLVRRLSPNNRKLETDDEGVDLVEADMLRAMALEVANLHQGTLGPRDDIVRDLESRPADWLRAAARRAATAVTRDFKAWKTP
jgi:uncharacterized protein (DUF2252 family)